MSTLPTAVRGLITALAAVAWTSTALALGMDTPLSNADASFLGEVGGDEAGFPVAGGGDVNGDGYDDFLIGANENDEADSAAGQAYLIFGRDSGWAMDTSLGSADASFLGVDNDDHAGAGISVAGDLNGDGFADLVIGAPGNDDGTNNAGKTYVLFGAASGWSQDVSLSMASASFEGEANGDQSGIEVDSGGDVNGDGYDDLLIGAPYNNDEAQDAGKVYLVLGGQNVWGPDLDLEYADGSFLGEDWYNYAGHSVAIAGDVDGDGHDDILIGAYGNDDADYDAGKAYLVLGHAAPWATDVGLAGADASFLGEDWYDYAGYEVAGAGDVDGDGLDDFLIGSPNNGDAYWEAGQAYLVLGAASGWTPDTSLAASDASFRGPGLYYACGGALAGAGDLNGDGYDDMAIGCPYASDLALQAGETFVIYGDAAGWAMDTSLDQVDASLLGEGTWDTSGASVSGAGDVDGDGADDLLVGAPYTNLVNGSEGEAYLVRGFVACADLDGDGYIGTGLACPVANLDCDDADPAQHPGADEYCNGEDDDCDGLVDEDDAVDAGTWYADMDGDGYGDPDDSVTACVQPLDRVADGTDCDDADATVNPAADEVCDGIDNDCDGAVDEDDALDPLTWYADGDGDGYGDMNDSELACVAPPGYVGDRSDCDDTDAAVNPVADEVCDGIDNDCDGDVDEDDAVDAGTWYTDGDGDGYGDPATGVTACAGPAGTVEDGWDCDDTDASVNPGADEECDGIDNDCDGETDEEDAINPPTWYADDDGDGFGDTGDAVAACVAPAGYVPDATDCDDANAAVNPDAQEVCDGIDNDCDGDVDGGAVGEGTWYPDADGDGFGDDAGAVTSCTAPPDHVAVGGDCDDGDAAVYPGATEICDGIDNDCDASTDENGDTDGDGFSACGGDCDDDDANVNPDAEEVCNGVDDDCDPATDEGADDDGDGYSLCDGDCDDGDAAVHPAAIEQCNGIDDDCDGSVPSDEIDGDGDGVYPCDDDCDDTDPFTYPGAPELCDGVDNDCDGVADNGVDEDLDADGFNACQGDCDNNDPNVYPGAPEICDGKDDDCNGLPAPDELDVDGDEAMLCDGDCDDEDPALNLDDADGDGFSTCDDDCDDGDATLSPADDDGDGYSTCDGDCDDGDAAANPADADGDGYSSCDGDCEDGEEQVYPGAFEDCEDGLDNDCDGQVDEDDVDCAGDDDDATGDDDDVSGDDDTTGGGLIAPDDCTCRLDGTAKVPLRWLLGVLFGVLAFRRLGATAGSSRRVPRGP